MRGVIAPLAGLAALALACAPAETDAYRIIDTDFFVRDTAMHGDRVSLLVTDPATGLVSLVLARLRPVS